MNYSIIYAIYWHISILLMMRYMIFRYRVFISSSQHFSTSILTLQLDYSFSQFNDTSFGKFHYDKHKFLRLNFYDFILFSIVLFYQISPPLPLPVSHTAQLVSLIEYKSVNRTLAYLSDILPALLLWRRQGLPYKTSPPVKVIAFSPGMPSRTLQISRRILAAGAWPARAAARQGL